MATKEYDLVLGDYIYIYIYIYTHIHVYIYSFAIKIKQNVLLYVPRESLG